MVERFNDRIADILKIQRFNSAQDMEQTLMRYVALYNHQLPQPALQSKTPMQAMKRWYQAQPELFNKRPEIVRDATLTHRAVTCKTLETSTFRIHAGYEPMFVRKVIDF